MLNEQYKSWVQDELAALERFRGQCTRPTRDLLEFFKLLTDGEAEGEDGIPPDSRVGAGYAIGIIHAVARVSGMSGEDVVAEILASETASKPDGAE